MLVDGIKIADDLMASIRTEVGQMKRAPRLLVITCAPNFETKKYLEMKRKRALSVGIDLNVVELPEDSSTKDVLDCLHKLEADTDGVVVQLPLPPQIDKDVVLQSVSIDRDPDGFQFGLKPEACLSPVVGAIDEISLVHEVKWEGKKVVILGEGRLVGLPAYYYAQSRLAEVIVLTRDNFDEALLKTADIIISGIGRPHFITSEMVKEGVVVFDAGTSEDGGLLVGDVSPAVAEKASLFTPVPGGIGPITIAYLLRNLVQLVRQ